MATKTLPRLLAWAEFAGIAAGVQRSHWNCDTSFLEIRRLIRDVSLANPLWGAPRIDGELLKLGIEIGQTTVAKYMAKERRPPSQGWRTFISNHAEGIAALSVT